MLSGKLGTVGLIVGSELCYLLFTELLLRYRLGAAIDFLAQYYLVDRAKLWGYARAFAAEDEDEDGIISFQVYLLSWLLPLTTSKQAQYLFSFIEAIDADSRNNSKYKQHVPGSVGLCIQCKQA